MVTNTGGPPAGVSSDGIDQRTQLPMDQGIGNNSTFVTPTLNSSAFEDISRQINEIHAERKKLTDYLLSLNNKLSALQATRAANTQILGSSNSSQTSMNMQIDEFPDNLSL